MKKWLQKLLATWFKGWVPEVKDEKKPKPEPMPLPGPGPVPPALSTNALDDLSSARALPG